jgi:ABC-2 type transport system ATP-binding protein
VLTAAQDDAWPQRLAAPLLTAGLRADVAPAPPNLEDVFVAATKPRHDAEQQAAHKESAR